MPKDNEIILSAIEQIKSESDVEDFNWSYADGLDRAIVILREILQDNKKPIALKDTIIDNYELNEALKDYIKAQGFDVIGVGALLNKYIEMAFISGANWQKINHEQKI